MYDVSDTSTTSKPTFRSGYWFDFDLHVLPRFLRDQLDGRRRSLICFLFLCLFLWLRIYNCGIKKFLTSVVIKVLEMGALVINQINFSWLVVNKVR